MNTPQSDLHTQLDILRREIALCVVGQEKVVDLLLISLLTGNHALMVGVPGVAKTLLCSTLSKCLGLSFQRIQFTPDLMPMDITGSEIMEINDTGKRHMKFVKGPIFANIVLADEINRTPPKTQAALLEAMQEHQVTCAGIAHPLSNPFMVLATQNPIEQEGTYPLPEAQQDRFLFHIEVSYPNREEEVEVLRRTTGNETPQVSEVLNAEVVLELQKSVRDIPLVDHVLNYALDLTRSTRAPEQGEQDLRTPLVREYVQWGAGPRAAQGLIIAAKANAFLKRRTAVSIEDVQQVALPVLRHRLTLNFSAGMENITASHIVNELIASVRPQDYLKQQASSVVS